MQVEVYVGDSGCFAVVPQGGSAKLPVAEGPWGKLKDLDLAQDGEARAGLDVGQCLEDIERQGYHISEVRLEGNAGPK